MTTPASDSDATPKAPEAPEEITSASPADSALDGRYVLDREIAHGGMGRVFAGRDVRLSRPVAIKMLRQAHPSSAARFEQEVLLAARLQHPGIVSVYDAGFWPTGEPFLVMKLVLGRSFDRVIADAETMADRLALLPNVVAVADALAYAHDQGIVHRDLKPSNIIVGAFGETVVLDWGLAKDLRASTSATTVGEAAPMPGAAHEGTTLQGTVLGTPAYMAPEQAAGEAVDVRADVYALGAILYQTLSGLAPAASNDGAPYAPLPRLEPHVPRDLQAIISQAMSAQKSDRYPSAFEMAEDLKRFLSGHLVRARRRSWLGRGLAVLGVVMAGMLLWRC